MSNLPLSLYKMDVSQESEYLIGFEFKKIFPGKQDKSDYLRAFRLSSGNETIISISF
jgi:hypothetical protein